MTKLQLATPKKNAHCTIIAMEMQGVICGGSVIHDVTVIVWLNVFLNHLFLYFSPLMLIRVEEEEDEEQSSASL